MDAVTPGRHAPEGVTSGESFTLTKRHLRRQFTADRSRVDQRRIMVDNRERTQVLLAELDALAPVTGSPRVASGRLGSGSWIACYSSRSDEPGTLGLIEEFFERGHRVLLPHLGQASTGPIGWAELTDPDALVRGPHGIDQPEGPALGPDALAWAELIIVPALAGTPRGVRLGLGAGWYDRALVHRRSMAPVWVLLRDSEVVDDLPVDEHDVLVDALVTPTRVVHAQHA